MLANDNIKKLKKKSLHQIQVVNVSFFVSFSPLGPFGSIKQPTANGWNLQPFLCEIMNFCGKSPRFEKKKI
jgi:hypothetical protein